MNTVHSLTKSLLGALWVGAALHSATAHANNAPAQTPLFVSQSTAPLNMLVMGRDHKLYYEAYNDASDLDGDGALDVGFKPTITYYGYFNTAVCYTHINGRFEPNAVAGPQNSCSNSWSGNFLNYLATSRMDALRKVLYGGYRAIDTASDTVLRAAFIPQDAHSSGKEYDPARDSFKISDYAPLSTPAAGYRHMFAITTLSDDGTPILRVLTNTQHRIWDWVSKEAPVASGNCVNNNTSCTSRGSSSMSDYALNVLACPGNSDLREGNCKAYADGSSKISYKPTGLLHDFGENDSMKFGLLTGSYAKNTKGGVLRSNIDSFTREVDSTTGQFRSNINDGIVATLNKLRIVDFNYSNHQYKNCGWIADVPITSKADGMCAMWGNPLAEMMFEGLRYFAGATSGSSAFTYASGARDTQSDLKLPAPKWIPPYAPKASGGGGHQSCAVPVMTVISDINPSYDYTLPGSHFNEKNDSFDLPPKLTGLNVSTATDAIGTAEGINGKNFFIGQSTAGNADNAPTAKVIQNLSWARGLSPEEPSKQGTFYSAGISKFAAENAVGGDKEMLTYSIALASPLPQITFPIGNTGNQNITLVPYAKSVGGGYGIDPKGNFQPTNQIVDYYVVTIANTTGPNGADYDASVNGGRPYAQFRINYEDVEQGADHDMDAIVLYTLSVDASGSLNVALDSEYASGGIIQLMGYVISGTTADGIYLDVRDKDTNGDHAYKLNTPQGRAPGWCEKASNLASKECKILPLNAQRTFTAASAQGAEFLKDPLWYAAKYGIPNRTPAEVTGDPDNYFLVTNALTLKDQLTSAFNDIMQRNNSVTSPSVKPTTTQTADSNFFVYRTDYNVETWSGNLIKETIDTNSGNRTSHWNAASGSVSGRTIKMANGSSLANLAWSNLTEDQQKALHINPQTGLADNAGEERLAFIKGENDNFRKRSNRLLGDIINSSPVVVEGAQYLHYLANAIEKDGDYSKFATDIEGRTPLVFVGANDGMLHAFNSETGKEEFAFVPSAVIPNLNKLTSPGYNEAGGEHHFFVDGTPVVRDVYIKGQWRTVLVGTLRAGGRSIFALDITNPNNISLLWELNEGDDLQSGETLSDVGYSFPVPTIARLHNGNWAVVTGNGYDSASNRAVLFLIDIATGDLTKIPTSTADASNGLSSVRVADNNSDGIADYVYAGDLKGNLWRFDLDPTGTAGSNGYQVSFGGTPLFTAVDESNTPQAITAPPSLVRHPDMVGYIAMFGTGRYFQLKDKETDKLDTLYGIWDTQTTLDTVATTTLSLSKKNLLEQTFEEQTSNTWNADNPELPTVSKNIRILSDEAITWGPSDVASPGEGHYGWRLDLKIKGSDGDGERIVDEMAARGQVLLFTTRTPSNDPCEAGLTGWTYGINPFTGGRTNFNVFDFNKSTTVSDGDSYNGTVVSGFETPAGGVSLSGDTLFSTDGSSIAVDFGGTVSGRQSWQVIPEDE